MASADGGGLRSGPEFNLAVHVAEGVVDTRNNRSQPCVYLLSVLPECGRELPHLCRSGADRCMRLDDGERPRATCAGTCRLLLLHAAAVLHGGRLPDGHPGLAVQVTMTF